MKRQYLPDNEDFTYLSEILRYMKKTEMNRRCNINCHSPQISWRRLLVDWMCVVASKLNIGSFSTHLAIKLLDSFMGGHDIEEHRLHFVSIGCLRIATKFEEKDSRVPNLKSISALLPEKYQRGFSVAEYRPLEEMILKYIDWNVFVPTASHFVDMLMPFCIQEKNTVIAHLEQRNSKRIPLSKSFQIVEKNFKEHVSYFLDVSLQAIELMHKLPSRVAAATIYCSRQMCALTPTWTSELEIISGLAFSQFEDCSTILQNVYENALRDDAENNAQIPAKRAHTVGYQRETPLKKQKLSNTTTNDIHEVAPHNLTSVSNDYSNCTAKFPVVELGRKVSSLNEKNTEIPIIDISPDEGYSSMSCSSTGIDREDSIRHSASDDIFMDPNEISDENIECDSFNKCTSSNKHGNINALHDLASTAKSWKLQENKCLEASERTDPVTFTSNHFILNCTRNLKFDDYQEESSQNSFPVLQDGDEYMTKNNKRLSMNNSYDNMSYKEDINPEVIVID